MQRWQLLPAETIPQDNTSWPIEFWRLKWHLQHLICSAFHAGVSLGSCVHVSIVVPDLFDFCDSAKAAERPILHLITPPCNALISIFSLTSFPAVRLMLSLVAIMVARKSKCNYIACTSIQPYPWLECAWLAMIGFKNLDGLKLIRSYHFKCWSIEYMNI